MQVFRLRVFVSWPGLGNEWHVSEIRPQNDSKLEAVIGVNGRGGSAGAART
jgi:hypothetical protein